MKNYSERNNICKCNCNAIIVDKDKVNVNCKVGILTMAPAIGKFL